MSLCMHPQSGTVEQNVLLYKFPEANFTFALADLVPWREASAEQDIMPGLPHI